jgi:hypothetical protein
MALEILLDPELHGRLVGHLTSSEVEEVAFLAARIDPAGAVVEAVELHVLTPADFAVQNDYHVRLTDAAQGRVIRWAHERSATLIEAHAHRSRWPVKFSPSDLSGLGDWVPHIRWRLPNRPYVALVFGDDSFDALAWTGEVRTPQPLAGLRVGDRLLVPTGLTYAEFTTPQRT